MPPTKPSAVLIYSGGLDSTVLLYQLRRWDIHVRALSIDYGQRHVRELSSAQRICGRLNVEHRIADLSGLRSLMGGSSQTDIIPVPEGHYADDNMRTTVVPNRNMLMLSAAAAWAVATDSTAVAYAAHAGDHAQYPDCRPVFIISMAAVLRVCHYEPVELWVPFERKTKADIVKLGVELRVPFEDTWSCYKGEDRACGRCGTCVERLEAFHLVQTTDPVEYTDRSFYKTVTAP